MTPAFGAKRERGDHDLAPTFLIRPRDIADGQEPVVEVARDRHGHVVGVDLVLPAVSTRHSAGLVIRCAGTDALDELAGLVREAAEVLAAHPVEQVRTAADSMRLVAGAARRAD